MCALEQKFTNYYLKRLMFSKFQLQIVKYELKIDVLAINFKYLLFNLKFIKLKLKIKLCLVTVFINVVFINLRREHFI